jgi:hypothetical protein
MSVVKKKNLMVLKMDNTHKKKDIYPLEYTDGIPLMIGSGI